MFPRENFEDRGLQPERRVTVERGLFVRLDLGKFLAWFWKQGVTSVFIALTCAYSEELGIMMGKE